MKRIAFGLGLAAIIASAPSLAQERVEAGPPQNILLTLYADGIAIVEERRTAILPGGPATVSADGLPESLLPDSVVVEAAGVQAGDVRLGTDRIDQARLLALSLNKRIVWAVPDAAGGERRVEGRLIAYRGGVVMEVDGQIETQPAGRLILDSLPEGLSEGTWISAAIAAESPGDTPIRIGYLTPGIGWSVDYEAQLAPDEKTLALAGRYAIANSLDRVFPNATTRLVAGSVNRVSKGRPPRPHPRAEMAVMRTMAATADAAPSGPPVQAALGDLHVYDLDAALDVPASATVRRALFAPATIPVEKQYRLEGRGDGWPGRGAEQRERQRPDVRLRFVNAADGPLAKPLPAGLVRVMGALAADTKDTPKVVLGEARIGHKAVGEEIILPLGRAFDVTAERKMTYFRHDPEDNQRRNRPIPYETAHEIILHNARAEPVTVEVVERFSADWRLLNAEPAARETHARSAVWRIDVPAGGETTMTYRIRVEP